MIIVLAALAAPSAASAHPRTPTIALDFRLELSRATLAVPGVRTDLVDGDRAIRLTVEPRSTLVVLGYVSEPFLRFTSRGVSVNTQSPTAAAARLVGGSEGTTRWRSLTPRHTFTWHDHRLAPPAVSKPGPAGSFSIPVRVDGRNAAITGTFWRARRPSLLPWLAAAAVAAGALALAGVRLARARLWIAAGAAGIGAAVALAMEVAFADADPLGSRSRWLEVGAAVVLVAAICAVLVLPSATGRRWVALTVGVYAALMGIDSSSTLWHGVVISSWPAPAVRAATVAAVVCGAGAVLLALASDSARTPRRSAR